MKVEVEIPRGKYCEECDFLEYDMDSTTVRNYCHYGGGYREISVFQCDTCAGGTNHPIKHPDCPGKEEV